MAYTTVDQVQGQFRSIVFATDTDVTIAEINQFIAEEEAVINSRLTEYYVTPVTANVDALNILSKVATLMVSHRVRAILQTEKRDELLSNWKKEAMDIMLRILPEGDKLRPYMPLPGATLSKGFPMIHDSVVSTRGSTDENGDKRGKFHVNQDEW